MMKLLRTILSAVALATALVSCSKSEFVEQNSIDRRINVSVEAAIEDLDFGIEDKATIASVIRLTWSEGDIVYAYDGEKYLGKLTVSPKSSDPRYAILTSVEPLIAPASGTTKISFVYGSELASAPEVVDGKINISIAEQAQKAIPFVLYGSLSYKGETEITKKEVPFYFATSVYKLNCANLLTGDGDSKIDVVKAEVVNVNTNCEIALSKSGIGSSSLAGSDFGTITRTAGFTLADSRCIFDIAVVKTPKGSDRTLFISQNGGLCNEANFPSSELKAAALSNTLLEMVPCEHKYIKIGGTKWSLTNIGAETQYDYGYYFSWGNVIGYELNEDKWYSVPEAVELVNGFTADNYAETKGAALKTDIPVDETYDAARKHWGGDWRVPEQKEFAALIESTYWKWDNTYKGYYVFYPLSISDMGMVNTNNDAYDNDSHLLFFPSTGEGVGNECKSATVRGFYWTSTIAAAEGFAKVACMSDPAYVAEQLAKGNEITGVDYINIFNNRYKGQTIRPISGATTYVFAEGIEVTPKSIVIPTEATWNLTATVTPDNATNKNVIWYSENPAIATVDQNGKVTAIAEGKTRIYAKSVSGGYVDFCKVKVTFECVQIGDLLWSTENLYVSKISSGYRNWSGTNHKVGDYFQWAAYEDYALPEMKDDKGLLLYSSFPHPMCGDKPGYGGEYRFEFKNKGWYFDKDRAPYYNNGYTKYTTDSDILERSDDPANIVKGGGWRTPTTEEFSDLVANTFTVWIEEHHGFYIFAPTPAHVKGTYATSLPEDLKLKEALTFFPAAGYAGTSLVQCGENVHGNYWTADAYSHEVPEGIEYEPTDACAVTFLRSRDPATLNVQLKFTPNQHVRWFGFSIRPVCSIEEAEDDLVTGTVTAPVDGGKLN